MRMHICIIVDDIDFHITYGTFENDISFYRGSNYNKSNRIYLIASEIISGIGGWEDDLEDWPDYIKLQEEMDNWLPLYRKALEKYNKVKTLQ